MSEMKFDVYENAVAGAVIGKIFFPSGLVHPYSPPLPFFCLHSCFKKQLDAPKHFYFHLIVAFSAQA